MTFSSKGEQITSTGGGSKIKDEAWASWNEKAFVAFDGNKVEVKEFEKKGNKVTIKKISTIGHLKVICQLGYQAQPDGIWDTKCEVPSQLITNDKGEPELEEFSEAEREYMTKYPNSYFEWIAKKDNNGQPTDEMERKQRSPSLPLIEYGLAFDFPDLMQDFSDAPYKTEEEKEASEEDMRPLRVSYNGEYFSKTGVRLGKRVNFKTNKVTKVMHEKAKLWTIASALGVNQAYEASGYDIGVLADGACYCNIEAKRSVNEESGKTYYTYDIKGLTPILDVSAGAIEVSAEDIKKGSKCPTDFVGVLMNGMEYDESHFIAIRKEYKAAMEDCVTHTDSKGNVSGWTWEESDLGKAYAVRDKEWAERQGAAKGSANTQGSGESSSGASTGSTKGNEVKASSSDGLPSDDDFMDANDVL